MRERAIDPDAKKRRGLPGPFLPIPCLFSQDRSRGPASAWTLLPPPPSRHSRSPTSLYTWLARHLCRLSMERHMRHRPRLTCIMALLVVAHASAASATEGPITPLPHAWLTNTQAPPSSSSWQSPLLTSADGSLEKAQPASHALPSLPSKSGFVAGDQKLGGHCSSGPNSAAACAAVIAVTAAVQSVVE